MLQNDKFDIGLYTASFMDKKKVVNSLHRQYVWFFVIGIICLVLDMTGLVLSVEMARVPVLIATAVSFVVATAVNYLLNVKFVFEGGKYSKKNEILFFFIVSVIAFFLTLLLMYILAKKAGVWYPVSKVVTVFLVSAFTFAARKLMVFKQ